MTDSTGAGAAATQGKSTSAGMGQAILLVLLLFIGFAGGGYYLGTQAQFNYMANPESGGIPILTMFDQSGKLKKWYWIHTKGWDRAGYAITVVLNGQAVGKFMKPDLDVDMTRFVKPGKNAIGFNATSLPQKDHDDNTSSYLTIQVMSAEKKPNEKNKFEGGTVLLEYTRSVTDTEDFNDLNEFEAID